MKKILLIAITVYLISLFGLSSCANAMVNDGNHIRKYTNNSATGSEGGAVPFSMYNDKMDMQNWNDQYDSGGCTTMIQDDALVISQTPGKSWYGVAITSDKAADHNNASSCIYDLSKIDSITFEAKADRKGTTMKFGACVDNTKSFELTEEYQKFTYSLAGVSHTKSGKHHCIVSIVHDSTTEPIVHYIKNIAFWDASGTEVVPEIVD